MQVGSVARVLILLAGLTPLAACQEPSLAELQAVPGAVAYVRLPSRMLTSDFLQRTAFNRDHRRDDTYAFGYLPRATLQALPSAVLADVVELDAQAWAHHDFDARTLEARPEATPAFGGAYEEFHNYAAMTAELQKINAAHPAITTLESAGKSVEGRDLWLLKIGANAAQDDGRPKLLYIANMHGDETVGRELLIYLARLLTDGYGKDPRSTALLNGAQIYLMPSMNPDGFEKNQRYNANNVDLNRDFPDAATSPGDASTGRAPETAAVMALHAQHHFVMSLNFHGGEVCFNTPWDARVNDKPEARFGDDALMQAVGRQYADLNGTMKANNGGSFTNGLTYGFEWYLVNGGMQDWSIVYRNSIHATVELSYTKWPGADNLPSHWDENREGLLRYLEAGLTGAHLKVVDQAGQLVNDVTVRVSSAVRDVHYPTGLVHRPTVAVPQTATVSAAGFQPTTVAFTPTRFDGAAYQTVVLARKG